MTNIIQSLRKIGIEAQETPENQDRKQMSRSGYRCIKPVPETWAKGSHVIVLRKKAGE